MSKHTITESVEQAPLVSIILINHNEPLLTLSCVESIHRNTPSELYEIILVDDGALAPLPEELLKEPLHVIRNERFLGFVTSINLGIKAARGTFFVLLNNNAVVTPNWLTNMLICMEKQPEVGAVGTMANYAPNYQQFHIPYQTQEELERLAQITNISNPELWERQLKLSDFNMMLRREVTEKLGLFDEGYAPGHFEDEDYSYRMITAGYELMLLRDTFIYQKPGSGYKELMPATHIAYQKNLLYFKEKWGFNPIYSGGIRHDILKLIQHPKDEPLKVLEVGCACGGTLLKLKNSYPNASLYGIELNEASARVAASFTDTKALDIGDGSALDYPEDFFDYIIFADVLEHLYDPWEVLRNMKKYLKKNGRLIASLPNVMHYTVIRDLVNGSWTYQDAGLLDRTHLRFFTRKEVIELFTSTGYQDLQFTNITIGISDNDRAFIDRLCLLTSPELRVQYETYQLLVSAGKA